MRYEHTDWCWVVCIRILEEKAHTKNCLFGLGHRSLQGLSGCYFTTNCRGNQVRSSRGGLLCVVPEHMHIHKSLQLLGLQKHAINRIRVTEK